MTTPRLRIAEIMAVVALLALDLGIVQALLKYLSAYLWIFLRYLPYPHSNPPWSLGLALVASMVVLVLPQLVFAILGGALVRKFKF
jgi:hypothetical protein